MSSLNYYFRSRKNKETTTLEILLAQGIALEIKVYGAEYKKYRRTALLVLFKAIKNELKFIRDLKSNAVGFIYHSDSSVLRSLYDMNTPASTYQATQVKTEMQKYGHKIRAGRNSLGLTQLKLAKILGIDRTYLSRIERGKHKLRKHEQERILDVLISLSISPQSYETNPQTKPNGPQSLKEF